MFGQSDQGPTVCVPSLSPFAGWSSHVARTSAGMLTKRGGIPSVHVPNGGVFIRHPWLAAACAAILWTCLPHPLECSRPGRRQRTEVTPPCNHVLGKATAVPVVAAPTTP